MLNFYKIAFSIIALFGLLINVIKEFLLFKRLSMRLEAVVEDCHNLDSYSINENCTLILDYEFNNENYNIEFKTFLYSFPKKGSKISIKVDPNNLKNIKYYGKKDLNYFIINSISVIIIIYLLCLIVFTT